MSTPTKVFLDLEDTIITNWDEALLTNVNVITRWLESLLDSRRTIQIHSFAIWDEKDKVHFVESGMKAMIEKALDVEIIEWLSIEEMQQIVEEWSGFRFSDRIDFMQLHGKHRSFEKICLARERDCRCILLDDAIPHRTIVDHERNLTIGLVPLHLIQGRELEDFQSKL
jgi:hypothetical protein